MVDGYREQDWQERVGGFLGEDVYPSHLPEPCHWGVGHVGAV